MDRPPSKPVWCAALMTDTVLDKNYVYLFCFFLAVEPERVTITGLERGWVVGDHKKVNITCHVDHVFPVPKILWVINNQPSQQSGAFRSERTGDTYHVESRLKLAVPQQPDQLRVACLVTNPSNASDVWRSASTQVDVYCKCLHRCMYIVIVYTCACLL